MGIFCDVRKTEQKAIIGSVTNYDQRSGLWSVICQERPLTDISFGKLLIPSRRESQNNRKSSFSTQKYQIRWEYSVMYGR